MIVNLILIVFIPLIFLVPRALLLRKMEFEFNRLFEPKYTKTNLLPYLIPYWGGIKLCEAIGVNFLKIISKVILILTAICIINTTIMRCLNITYGWYPIISVYYNIIVFFLNYIILICIAYKSARTIQSPLGILFCIIPPLSFYMQSTVVRQFFLKNKDELKGTFHV